MTITLDCKYPGAVAWGKNYPPPGRDHTNATNGSAPGYVAKPDVEHGEDDDR